MIREKVLSPYELVLEEIKEGRINPYDIDIFYLAKLFRESRNPFFNSGHFNSYKGGADMKRRIQKSQSLL